MTIDKLSGFPNPGFPKVIWFGSSSPPGEIFRLQDDLESRLQELGFEREKRDYVPHITIGRTKDDNDRKIEQLGSALEKRAPATDWIVPVDRLTLMESTLKPDGPEYNSVFRLDLGNST